MTLTIPDVEQWNPAALTTAGTAVGTLYKDLDQAVLNGTNKAEAVDWKGNAAAAAKTRMDLEKTRSSAVSQALMGLQTALNQHVTDLTNTKTKVLQLRDQAGYVPAPSLMPAFEVAPDGTVSPQKRIDWLGQHREKLSDTEFDNQSVAIRAEAAGHERDIKNALKEAESAAEAAVSTLNTAKSAVDTAYNGLGDPNLGVAAPAPTAPASVTAPQPSPGTTQYTPHGGGNSHGGGTNSYGGNHASDVSYATPSSGGAPTATPSGNVKEWIEQAKQILIAEGYPADQLDDNAIATIIQHESGGDPNAINNWDSNAAAGHPSKGLMQCIDSTFNRWAVPGHTDIWNPVDNIVAASRYSIATYGSLDKVPGVAAVSSGGNYVGY